MTYLLGNLRSRRTEDVVTLVGVALQVRVEVGDNSPLHAREGVVLHQHLRAHTRVDARDAAAVARAVHVPGAEADRGETRVDSLPVVVVVGDVQLARVLGGVVVGVAD